MYADSLVCLFVLFQLTFSRGRSQVFFALGFQSIRTFNDLTEAQVTTGSWARKPSRRPAATQKGHNKCECVLLCYFPTCIQENTVIEAMCMNASIIPLKVFLNTGLVHLPWRLTGPSTGWRLLNNLMSWLHLHCFSGVVQEAHPKN